MVWGRGASLMGSGALGVVVEVEVARHVDARLPVGQGEVEGLALGDVSQDQAPRLKTFV